MAALASSRLFPAPDFRLLFESAPGLCLVLSPDLTIVAVSESYLRASMTKRLETVGRLAGGVAHDFNNILAIVSACTDLLRDYVDPMAKHSEYLSNIRKAIERGAQLTRQLVAFSRKQIAQPFVFDLNERLMDIAKLLRPLMGDDVEVAIVRKSEFALIEADPGQIDQILVNLAFNARDAMPHGGKLVLETTGAQMDEPFASTQESMKAGKYIGLAVSDNGTGMDEATVSRIFEPYFTTKEIGRGTGLGLSTVYASSSKAKDTSWFIANSAKERPSQFTFPVQNIESRVFPLPKWKS